MLILPGEEMSDGCFNCDAMKWKFLWLSFFFLSFSCKNPFEDPLIPREPVSVSTNEFTVNKVTGIPLDSIAVYPIAYKSFLLTMNGRTVLVDPPEDIDDFKEFADPDIILLTGTHPSHNLLSALKEISSERTSLVVPKSVKSTLSANLEKQIKVLKPDKETLINGIRFKAFPNNFQTDLYSSEIGGYLLSTSRKQVFISGENGDITKLPNLKNIDVAFIGMDLSSREGLDHLIEKVLEIQPQAIYPYFYRGAGVYSEVAKLRRRVEAQNPSIRVHVLNWFPFKE